MAAFPPARHERCRGSGDEYKKLWGEHPIVAPRRFLFSQFVVKMVSLSRAVFWWETARFRYNTRFEAASLHGEINANNLLIISGVHMPIGEGRMRPQHIASGRGVGRLQQMGAADLFVGFRGEPGDDEITFFVEEKEAVAIFHDESIGPADRLPRGGGLECFPDPLARGGFQAAQLAVTADAIDVSVLQKRRAHDGIEMCGVVLA